MNNSPIPRPPILTSKPVIPPKTNVPAAPDNNSSSTQGAASPSGDWKAKLAADKLLKAKKDAEEEEKRKQAEEERWAGIPEWKRKVLQEKVRIRNHIPCHAMHVSGMG